MRFLPGLSIRSRLTLMFMVASGTALLLTCAAFISYDAYTFRLSKVEDVATLAEIIGSNSTGALTYQDTRSATEVLRALKSKKQISAACIITVQISWEPGSIIAKTQHKLPSGSLRGGQVGYSQVRFLVPAV